LGVFLTGTEGKVNDARWVARTITFPESRGGAEWWKKAANCPTKMRFKAKDVIAFIQKPNSHSESPARRGQTKR